MRRSWPVNHDVTYQTIHGSAESFCHETWKKNGISDMNSISDDIHYWIPLFNCILNLHLALNKRKSYRSFLVPPPPPPPPPIQFQMKTGVIVTSSIHEPLAVVTYWPTILTLFLWTLPSKLRCQPGTFQRGGSSSQEAARRPAPLVLCWSGSANHSSSADCIVVNSNNRSLGNKDRESPIKISMIRNHSRSAGSSPGLPTST